MGIILPIAVLVLSLLTVPSAVDIGIGDNTLPNDALYGIERAGESIRNAFGVLDDRAIVEERINEAIELSRRDLPERALKVLSDADKSLQDVPTNQRPDLEKRIDDVDTAIRTGGVA